MLTSGDARRPYRRRGALALGLGSVLTVLAMAHHPTGVAQTESVRAVVQGAALAAWVHGILIVLQFVVLFGFLEFAEELGWEFRRVRSATAAYALGAVAMTGAALVNGFVVPRLTLDHAMRGGTEALTPSLRFAWQANQVLAQAGTIAISAAIVGWSAVLLGRGTGARILGLTGLAIGVGILLAVVVGALRLDVQGMGAVLIAQAAWSVGVAVWLFPGRVNL